MKKIQLTWANKIGQHSGSFEGKITKVMLVTVCYNLFRLTWKNAGSVSSSCALGSHVRKHLQPE